ncbi:unnamed protein product [Heterosigma akashiwo]
MILSLVAALPLLSLISNSLLRPNTISPIRGSLLKSSASRLFGTSGTSASISPKPLSLRMLSPSSGSITCLRARLRWITPLTPTPGFKAELSDANMYRSMVGTLAWVANWTRPELAFTVHKLQRTQCNPEAKHFEAAERAFRYLKGTQSESLRLGGDLVLRAFSDSDLCSDRIDGKSVTGYILFLGDTPILWSSKLQGVVTTSTAEAEYLALRSSIKDIMWLRHLLADLGCPQQEPTPVVEDNSACIEWANDLVVSKAFSCILPSC